MTKFIEMLLIKKWIVKLFSVVIHNIFMQHFLIPFLLHLSLFIDSLLFFSISMTAFVADDKYQSNDIDQKVENKQQGESYNYFVFKKKISYAFKYVFSCYNVG